MISSIQPPNAFRAACAECHEPGYSFMVWLGGFTVAFRCLVVHRHHNLRHASSWPGALGSHSSAGNDQSGPLLGRLAERNIRFVRAGIDFAGVRGDRLRPVDFRRPAWTGFVAAPAGIQRGRYIERESPWHWLALLQSAGLLDDFGQPSILPGSPVMVYPSRQCRDSQPVIRVSLRFECF